MSRFNAYLESLNSIDSSGKALLQKKYSPKNLSSKGIVIFDKSLKEVLNKSNLLNGTYTFYFGIDLLMNGSIDMNKAFYDKVKVTITP
jgi:hypothetical protein